MSPTETKEGSAKESATKREIEVEIPVQDVNRQTESPIQKYQKVARIPGFRRGHVPASIIRQRFSEEIKTDMVEALIPRFFRQEAERLSLHPVSQPRVTDLHLHDGEPLRFKAAFEVLPEIKLEGYKELRADKPEVAVAAAEVEAVTLRSCASGMPASMPWRDAPLPMAISPRSRSTAIPSPTKKRPVKVKPVHMDEVLVEIAASHTMPEFSEHLRGTNPQGRTHVRCELSRRYAGQAAGWKRPSATK